MNLQKIKPNRYSVFSLVIVVSAVFLASAMSVSADWTPPAFTPPACPSSNPACLSPINIGTSTASVQLLNGALGITGFLEAYGNVGIGTTPDPSQALSIYNGNIDLKRLAGNSTPAGLGPQIILESPSGAGVTTEVTTWTACGGSSPTPCGSDTTPTHNNKSSYDTCVATDAGSAYNDVDYTACP